MNQEFKVGQFVLERPLGEGGMAEVWLGRNPHIGTTAAIKFLNRQFASNRDVEERFLNEGRRQGSLDHPNIVKVYGFEYVGSQGFLILQYIDGKPLDLHLQSCRMGDEEILRVSNGVLSALGCAHAAGIVHRDVKPSNILLDRRGEPHLGDFGIVRAMGESSRTSTTARMGTPNYMSPEQITRPKEVDHRADIYSFGIVLYEMVTGRVPFGTDLDQDSSDFMVELAHVQTPPPPPRSLNPAIRPALEQVVLRCLAKEPAQRYSTCEELRDALARAMTGTVHTKTVVEDVPAQRLKTLIEVQRRAPEKEVTTPSSNNTTMEDGARPPLRSEPSGKVSGRISARVWTVVVAAVLIVGGLYSYTYLILHLQLVEKVNDEYQLPALLGIGCAANYGSTCDTLGTIYLEKARFAEAFPLVSKTCDVTSHSGCEALGVLYQDGLGTERDTEKARAIFARACNLGKDWLCGESPRVPEFYWEPQHAKESLPTPSGDQAPTPPRHTGGGYTAQNRTTNPQPLATTAAPSGVWRVVAYTFKSQTEAADIVDKISERHSDLGAEVFSPPGRNNVYLVTVGGAMDHDEALKMCDNAQRLGLPADTYVQNFSK